MASAGPYANLHLIPDNYNNIPPLSFLKAGCPSCYPTYSVKALKAKPGNKRHKEVARSIYIAMLYRGVESTTDAQPQYITKTQVPVNHDG